MVAMSWVGLGMAAPAYCSAATEFTGPLGSGPDLLWIGGVPLRGLYGPIGSGWTHLGLYVYSRVRSVQVVPSHAIAVLLALFKATHIVASVLQAL
jgi:hypothetical protein